MSAKKQSKADKAFIAKLKTLNFNVKSAGPTLTGKKLSEWAKSNGIPEQVKCDDCGTTAKLTSATMVKLTLKPKHDDSGEVEVTE